MVMPQEGGGAVWRNTTDELCTSEQVDQRRPGFQSAGMTNRPRVEIERPARTSPTIRLAPVQTLPYLLSNPRTKSNDSRAGSYGRQYRS